MAVCAFGWLFASTTASHAYAHRYPEQTAQLWQYARAPALRDARKLFLRGLRRYIEAELEDPTAIQRAYLESAIHTWQAARALAPEDLEILFHLAKATARWEMPLTDGGVRRQNLQSVRLFRALHALDPEFETERVAFELGILYTRQHQWADAAREYERAQRLSLSQQSSANTLSNLAEVTMMTGDIEKALVYYQRALREARQASSDSVLAQWGTAVAYDRLGEQGPALEWAKKALASGGLRSLREQGVFFEPDYEVHYYEALGTMAQAETLPAPRRLEALRSAMHDWKTYLNRGGSLWPWAEIVQRHIDQCKQALGPSK